MEKLDANVLKHENENLKKEIAKLQKVKTGWMTAAIISFALFAITLALKLA